MFCSKQTGEPANLFNRPPEAVQADKSLRLARLPRALARALVFQFVVNDIVGAGSAAYFFQKIKPEKMLFRLSVIVKFFKWMGLVAIFASVPVWQACDNEEPELTEAQQLARIWRVSSGTANGNALPFDAGNLRLQFTLDDEGNPLEYLVQGSIPAGAKPNYNSMANRGTWSFTGSRIVFSEPGGSESEVNYSNLSGNTLTIAWSVPASLDKTEPFYEYQMVPD